MLTQIFHKELLISLSIWNEAEMYPLMNQLADIDLYCERIAPGFWNEPLNAVSNAAFVIAALIAWRLARRAGQTDLVTMGLIVLAGSIGVGSFLFHTFANSKTELADVIPIWTFVAVYVVVIIYRATGTGLFKTLQIVAITSVCVGITVWFTGRDITTEADAAPAILNGSLQYLPALIALGAFAVLMQLRGHPARHLVTVAAVVFLVSLGFRSIDLAICDAAPIGSHFLWHLLNGTMVGVLLSVLILHFPRS